MSVSFLVCLMGGGSIWAGSVDASSGEEEFFSPAVPVAAELRETEIKVSAALEALEALFTEERRAYYAHTPGTGPRDAPPVVADRFEAATLESARAWERLNMSFLTRLKAIDREPLSAADRLNYDMFAFMLRTRLTFAEHKSWRMPFYSDSGFHTDPLRSWSGDNLRTSADYQAYTARLKDIPRYLAAHTDNLREAIEAGWTMPKIVLDGLLPTFSSPLVEEVTESSFYTPFLTMSDSLSEAEQQALRAAAQKVIKEDVLPAYKQLNDFMTGTYYPAARNSVGISDVPGGAAYYADMVKYYTTLDVTPDEVHALGLREVARIRGEMEEIIRTLGFEGTFADFLSFLRSDPQFYASSEKDLLMHASYIAKKIDGRMPSLFAKLPRQPYGVEAVPASIAPNYTTGRYVGAPLTAPKGGYYWVNTYALEKRPLYVLPALTLHEGVPGHHHQISLSKELENVPEFRLGLYPHAFGEGWGLYAEKLGIELGIYETPYENFGRLTYEMWRACRLVIDTGLHAKGWSRAEAIKLLEENSALSTHNIRTEVDRYISWPGQALAYKMGELTFLRLRGLAKAELGAAFNVRDFHDFVLSLGGVPMSILEEKVKNWIETEKKK